MPPFKPTSTGSRLTTSMSRRAADIVTSAADTDVSRTLPAVAGKKNVISGLSWSYRGTSLTTAVIQVLDDGVVVFDADVTVTGPGQIFFDPPLANDVANTALVLTAKRGGPGVVAKLQPNAWWLE